VASKEDTFVLLVGFFFVKVALFVLFVADQAFLVLNTRNVQVV